MGEVITHKRSPQWIDEGTYKKPKDSDNIRVPRLEVDDATTFLDKDVSNNMTFTDAVTGTKKLAELALMNKGTSLPESGNDGELFFKTDSNELYVYIE